MEREKKWKKEGKKRGMEKEKKIIPFDVFGYREERKEELWEFYLFLICLQGEEKGKMHTFTFVPFNDVKIHILEHL